MFSVSKSMTSPDFQRFKSLDPPPLLQNFIDDPPLWSPGPRFFKIIKSNIHYTMSLTVFPWQLMFSMTVVTKLVLLWA